MHRDERGQVTAFVVVFAVTLIFVAGLVLDGGYVLAARRRAVNEAEGAARAGAATLAVEGYRASGPLRLDPARAESAARDYLAQTGHGGDVAVSGDRVAVVVRFDQPLQILGLGGLGAQSVTGRGEARAVLGVERAES
jgi:Putative Flp pilus-assembly TadE/G-like